MLITCPTCAAEYNVPGPLAPGRAVRCARCSSQWAPVPPLPAAPVTEAAAPEPPRATPAAAPALVPFPMVRPAARKAPGRLPLLLAWGGSAVLLLALAGAAVAWREPVMHAWPPSERVYGTLGLTARP